MASKMSYRICIDCRTLLGHGEERCDAARFHRTVSLSTAEGRERLRAHVWGPQELRARAANAARAGSLGALVEGVSCGSCGDAVVAGMEAPAVLLAVALAFGLVFIVYWIVATFVARVRRYRGRARPQGVDPALPATRQRWKGRIVGGEPVTAPITDGEGVGSGIALESSDAVGRGSHVLFAGRTGGFQVELEGGGLLELPPGRIRVVPAREGWERIPPAQVRVWASQLDRREVEEPHPPIPGDRGRVVVLEVGDTVELDVATTTRPGEGGAYREATAVRVAVGVPLIT